MTRKAKLLLFTLLVLGCISLSAPFYAYADAETDVIIAIGTATTEVSQSEAASSSISSLISNATLEANQALEAGTSLTSAVSNATTSVTAIDNAIVVINNASGIDQSSQTVSSAKNTVSTAQAAVDTISTIIAQSELAQATTARAAVTTAMNTAATEFSQANAAISNAQDAINALQATIATVRDVLQGVDDAGVEMILPFSMQMGGVTYNHIYVGSNAVITFGTDQGYYYWTTPDAPSISVGGMDWTTWSYGSGITYSTTANSLDIAWDVRAYPTRDSSVQLTQLRFNADVNPTTGAWIATVSGIGPYVDGTRWNYRETTNGAITEIVDTDLIGANEFSGSIGQGSYTVPTSTVDNSVIQGKVDAANAQLAALNQRISAVVLLNNQNQSAVNSIPSTASVQTAINNATVGKTNLQSLLTIKSSNLISAINNNIPTPPPVIDAIVFADGRATVSMSMPTGYASNTWFYRISTTDAAAANPYADQTLNTDGSPSSFEISGLTEGATYTISVANWSGPTSTYTDYTLSIPAPQMASIAIGGGYPVDTTPQTPPDETIPPVDSGTTDGQTDAPVDDTTTDTPSTDTDPAQDSQQSSDQSQSSDTSSPSVTDIGASSPDSLPTDIPLLPSEDLLVPHIQEDKAGELNGGIEFFGTKDSPQVIGEDGKLTPAAPPPGSGLPIPPDAITTESTFIGQPGGTTFNSPDVAVPVAMTYVCHIVKDDTGNEKHIDVNGIEHHPNQCTYLPAALDAIPGAGEAIQAIGALYTNMANIGNDMSPVTRKKAKKILLATIVVGQIAAFRRRFGE